MRFVVTTTEEEVVALRSDNLGVDIICGPVIVASFRSDSGTLVIDERAMLSIGIKGRVRLLSETNDDFIFAERDNADHT